MNVQRFEGREMAAVLAQIRRELGPEAVIMSTRTRRGGGLGGRLRRRPTVEVIAGLPEPSAPPLRAPAAMPAAMPGTGVATPGPAPGPLPSAIPSLAERYLQDAGLSEALAAQAPPQTVGAAAVDRLEISGAARLAAQQAPSARRPSEAPPRPQAVQPAVAAGGEAQIYAAPRSPVPLAIAEDIRSLREEIAMLRRAMQTPEAMPGPTPLGSGLPGAARDLLQRLRQGGVSAAFVERAADTVAATLDRDANAEAARAAVLRAVLSQLPSGSPPEIPAVGTTGVFVVGPSGAGKTLSAVKLALALQGNGRRVVLANADQQRPGANAQLSAYGEALGIPTAPVYAPADLQSLVAQGADSVLVVDTAGGLPRGTEALALRALVQALPERQVLLTLSAGSGAGEMARALETFAALAPDGLIVSQADEAVGFGATVSFLGESGIPLFFLSQHADVLRPLEVASPATLLERVLQQGRGEARDEPLAS